MDVELSVVIVTEEKLEVVVTTECEASEELLAMDVVDVLRETLAANVEVELAKDVVDPLMGVADGVRYAFRPTGKTVLYNLVNFE